MRGSSISRPPTSESLVFIHAGGLHGVPMIVMCRLMCSACRSNGRICLAVVGDREVPLLIVGLSGRHVVEGVVVLGDEVGCADRLPQEVQAVAGTRVEQVCASWRCARVAGGLASTDRRRVGERGAEAGHALEVSRRVDSDRQVLRGSRREGHGACVMQLLRAVRCRDPDLCGGALRRRRSRSRSVARTR